MSMTREEYLTKRREYYQKNKHKWAEYRKTHRDHINDWKRADRAAHPEKYKKYWQNYWQNLSAEEKKEKADKDRAYHHSEKGQQAYKKYYEAHKQEFIERAKKSNANHKDERRAQSVVNHNIERGKLKRQPCEVCGAEKTDAHHDDYNKPLDVRWLCRRCHADWHSKHEPIRATNEKQCALCGKVFVFTHRAQKFCSDACRRKWDKAKAHQYYLENIEKWKQDSARRCGASAKE